MARWLSGRSAAAADPGYSPHLLTRRERYKSSALLSLDHCNGLFSVRARAPQRPFGYMRATYIYVYNCTLSCILNNIYLSCSPLLSIISTSPRAMALCPFTLSVHALVPPSFSIAFLLSPLLAHRACYAAARTVPSISAVSLGLSAGAIKYYLAHWALVKLSTIFKRARALRLKNEHFVLSAMVSAQIQGLLTARAGRTLYFKTCKNSPFSTTASLVLFFFLRYRYSNGNCNVYEEIALLLFLPLRV